MDLHLVFVRRFRRGVIYFYARVRFERAQRLVASGNDLIAFLQTIDHLNIGDAGNSGCDRHELSAFVPNHKDALNFRILFQRGRDGSVRSGARSWAAGRQGDGILPVFLGRLVQIFFGSFRERLKRDRHYIFLLRRGDLGRRREPGTQAIRRILQRDHDLEILRFLVARSGLRRSQARTAEHRLRPDFGHFSFKEFPRDRVDGDFRVLPKLHAHNVGFIHHDFRRHHGHIGNRHEVTSGGVLDAGNDVFAYANGDIGDHSIDRRGVSGLPQDVAQPAQHRLILRQRGTRLPELRAGLRGAGLRGRQRSHGAIERGLSSILVLLGYQAFLEQELPALPVEFGMLQVRRARLDVCLRRYVVGIGGFHACVGGGNPGALRVDIGRGLHAFQAQQDVAFLDVVAFFHRYFSDFADPFPKNVRVSKRLDFSGGRDYGSQILAYRRCRLNSSDTLVDLPNSKPRAAGQDSGDTHTNADFLPCVHGFAALVFLAE